MSDLFLGNKINNNNSSKIDISTATVTLENQSFTYDGTIKIRNVNNVILNNKTLIIGTDYIIIGNKAINAGTYYLFILGMGDYEGFIGVEWSINKAQGSINISLSSLSIIGIEKTATVTITKIGDGIINTRLNNNNVITTEMNEDIITITSINGGNTIITITLDAGINYTGDSVTINVSVLVPNAILSNNTPELIQYAAQNDIPSTYWSVGDSTMPITIGAVGSGFTGATACAFIIGFDHNSELEGSGIHFQFGKTTEGINIAFVDSGYGTSKNSGSWFNMDISSGTTFKYWAESHMRTAICPAFLSALPLEWQNIIVDCTKYTASKGTEANSSITATTDKIWLLSYYEVSGSTGIGNSYEKNKQQQYSYYSNGNSKIKYKSNDESTACIWYTRSMTLAQGDYATSYHSITATGSYARNRTIPYGFAPGFKVA